MKSTVQFVLNVQYITYRAMSAVQCITGSVPGIYVVQFTIPGVQCSFGVQCREYCTWHDIVKCIVPGVQYSEVT